ncbi:MAG: flagellar protein FliS [Lachnospiraceae bacterium]|nr:flagellar protein FliS [Lachnospiraceae bacterium]MBO4762956.1 flagellar protein FliS [Lachnospiraceae bacterium]
MTQEQTKDYARRISQANRTELTVIVYDITLQHLSDCNAAFEKRDLEGFRHSIKQAQRFLCELMSTLDLKYPLAVSLLRLYEFAQRIIVHCDVAGTTDNLEVATRILSRLKDSFDSIKSQDTEGPVMENTEPVYAGLTYGKGTLNETDIRSDNRGFFA